ncbi:hypothetical protein Trydic_g13395 [Trypoxylus dichotomus]
MTNSWGHRDRKLGYVDYYLSGVKGEGGKGAEMKLMSIDMGVTCLEYGIKKGAGEKLMVTITNLATFTQEDERSPARHSSRSLIKRPIYYCASARGPIGEERGDLLSRRRSYSAEILINRQECSVRDAQTATDLKRICEKEAV